MADTDTRAFLGQGWAFPPAVDAAGEIALVAYEDDVKEAIRIILATNPSERVMRPDFGAGLSAFLFEPINTTTMALVRHRVEQALIEWEPRIDTITVEVTTPPGEGGRLNIDIRYRVRLTNTFYNLVYPFYAQDAQV